MKKCTSKEFIEYCDAKYPALKDNLAYRRLFFYLLFGTYEDHYHQDGYEDRDCPLVLSYKKLCSILDYNIDSHSHPPVFKLLTDFKTFVLPNFEWNDYEKPDYNTWEKKYGKCRTVRKTGIDCDVWEMARKELQAKGKAKYFYDTKRAFAGLNLVRDRADILAEYAEASKCFNLNPTQQLILDQLNLISLDGQCFKHKLTENRVLVEQAIDNLQAKPTDKVSLQEKKDLQRNILGSIEEDGRVFYRPTPLKRTPRLHHSTDCVLSLKSEVRKALCHGWTEADMVSSQLQILASLLDAKLCKAMLATQNVWLYLNKGIAPTKDQKSVYKQLVYGICFGTSERRSDNSLYNLLKPIGRLDLLKDPIIRELLDKRTPWHESINTDGYITDVWGEKHYLESKGWKTDIYGDKVRMIKDRWAGSLAGTKIQSIEMEIVSAVFEYERTCPKSQAFKIVLFQHDGFAISFYDKSTKATVQRRLNEALAAKAKTVGDKLGLDLSGMRLEFTDL